MKKNVFFFLGIIFLMVSCYPDGIEAYEDTDLVYTNYVDTFDFAANGTYSIPENIVKITGDLVDGETPDVCLRTLQHADPEHHQNRDGQQWLEL